MAVDTSGLERELDEIARRSLDEATRRLVQEARTTVPPFPRTGELIRSIQGDPATGSGGRFRSKVKVGAEHGVYQEFGTGPIFPKRAGGVLRFRTRGGQVVFAKSTRGVPKTRWWSRALAEWPNILRGLR